MGNPGCSFSKESPKVQGYGPLLFSEKPHPLQFPADIPPNWHLKRALRNVNYCSLINALEKNQRQKKCPLKPGGRPGLLGRSPTVRSWSSLSGSPALVLNHKPLKCCTRHSTLPGTIQEEPDLLLNSLSGKKEGKACPQRISFHPMGTPEGKDGENI